MNRTASRTAARLLELLPRERITRALGSMTDAHVPRAILQRVLRLYQRVYDVDMSEAVEPREGYATFNEFFTRRLRDGARPIATEPDSLVSPADGRLDDAGPIDHACEFLVKGQRYTVEKLLGSDTSARRFAGGSYFIVYLSPRDYHRVHAPCALGIEQVRHIPGLLYPVNRMGVENVPLLFARNERVVVEGSNPEDSTVAVVLVGAMVVGKITLAIDGPSRPPIGGPVNETSFRTGEQVVERGGELGAFQLGSTAVVLVSSKDQKPWRFDPSDIGTSVRMGQTIARCGAKR